MFDKIDKFECFAIGTIIGAFLPELLRIIMT